MISPSLPALDAKFISLLVGHNRSILRRASYIAAACILPRVYFDGLLMNFLTVLCGIPLAVAIVFRGIKDRAAVERAFREPSKILWAYRFNHTVNGLPAQISIVLALVGGATVDLYAWDRTAALRELKQYLPWIVIGYSPSAEAEYNRLLSARLIASGETTTPPLRDHEQRRAPMPFAPSGGTSWP